MTRPTIYGTPTSTKWGTADANISTGTHSLTVPSGLTDSCLLVGIAFHDVQSSVSFKTTLTVKWGGSGGTAMTLVPGSESEKQANSRTSYIAWFYLNDPTAMASTVYWSTSAQTVTAGAVASFTLENVPDTSQILAVAVGDYASTAAQVATITGTSGDSRIFYGWVSRNGTYTNVVTGATGVLDISTGTDTTQDAKVIFAQEDGASGSQTATNTLSSANNGAWTAVQIAGTSGAAYSQGVSGALTSAGASVKRTGKKAAGTLTSAGVVVKRAGKTAAGVLTSAGSLVRRAGKALAGVLAGVGNAVTQVPTGAATIDVTVGTDDAGQVTAGTMYLASTSLNVNSSGDQYAIEIFRDLPIPVGATITSAYLKVWTTSTSFASPNLTIQAQNSVSPAAPSATAYDISSRSKLTESVTWNASAIGIDAYKDSPDISAIIQEFIELGGYTKDTSDIAILLTSAGSGALRWASRDSFLSPPQLYIAWSAVSGTAYLQSVAGTVASVGTAVKRTITARAGTLTSAGSVVRRAGKSMSGVLASAGAVVKATSITVSGTLTSAGAIAKRMAKSVAGTLASSGVVATSRVVIVMLAGTLDAAGALVKQTTKATGGTLTAAGSVVKQTATSTAGVLTSGGGLSRQTSKALAGVVTSAGALTRQTSKALSGGLAAAGALTKRTGKGLAGVLSSVGSVTSEASRVLEIGRRRLTAAARSFALTAKQRRRGS